jgi:hypothetical protein
MSNINSHEPESTTTATNKQQLRRHELSVIRTELSSGDTSGLVYVRSSGDASSLTTAFLVTPRQKVLSEVNEKLAKINTPHNSSSSRSTSEGER